MPMQIWRRRDLSKETVKYLFVDTGTFRMRMHGTIELVPVLVTIGVTERGHKLVPGMQSGDKESVSNWREFFKDLKSRGLNSRMVTFLHNLPFFKELAYMKFT